MAIRLLLVDDEEDFLELLAAWLAFKGYDVSTARDGLEGLEKLRSSPYDLVLLDVMMPRLDGYGFCREVRSDEQLRSTPIVVLSAKRIVSEDEVKGLHADAYLEKMADHDMITSVINRVLAARSKPSDPSDSNL